MHFKMNNRAKSLMLHLNNKTDNNKINLKLF